MLGRISVRITWNPLLQDSGRLEEVKQPLRLRKGGPPNMTTQEQKRGASIQAPLQLKPSVDLAKLADLLAESIGSSQTSPTSKRSKRAVAFFARSLRKTAYGFVPQPFYFGSSLPKTFARPFSPTHPAALSGTSSLLPSGLRAKLGGELAEGNASRFAGQC